MLIDAVLDPDHFAEAGPRARRIEDTAYDGMTVSETSHDPFLPLALAAVTTSRIELSTGIAVAFARNPMTLANLGHDLQQLSAGRFVLGLGSQVKAHVTRRFSMPWDQPASRMREMVLAMRAIWTSWEDGAPLRFEGRHYQHTLMTPMFTPRPHGFGAPRVRVAAVGEGMTSVAGEVADGLLCHAFTTPDYVREVTRPHLAKGADRGGRDVGEVELVGLPMVGVAETVDRRKEVAAQVRKQVAFYASTPAYRPVLELHGHGALGDRLHAASVERQWDRMTDLIGDDVLDLFAVVGTAQEVASGLRDRYDGLFDRISLYAPYDVRDGDLDQVLAAYRGLAPTEVSPAAPRHA